MNKKLIVTFALCLLFLCNPVYSAIYHINPDVSSNGNGTAIAPFKSWGDLPRMGAGDDVYFRCGTTIKPSSALLINWSGTVSNRVIIGAYYMDGSKAVYGVSGKKPIVSGNNFTVPSGEVPVYSGLVDFINQDYITIQDLHLKESRGNGIAIRGNNGGSSDYPVVQRCDITDIYMSAIIIDQCPNNNGHIAYNYIYNTCLAGNQKLKLYSNHAGGIVIANSPNANAIIEKNFVCQTYGESITVWRFDSKRFDDSGYVVIQDNVDLGKGSLYLNGVRNVIVRRNLIVGNNNGGPAYDGVQFGRSSGISINDEDLGGEVSLGVVRNIEVYDNFVGNCLDGIVVSSEGDSNLKDQFRNVKIYNNILIANYRGIKILRTNVDYFESIIRENIFYTPSGAVGESDIHSSNLSGWTSDIDMGSRKLTTKGNFAYPLGFVWQKISESDLLSISIESLRNAFKNLDEMNTSSDNLNPPVLKIIN